MSPRLTIYCEIKPCHQTGSLPDARTHSLNSPDCAALDPTDSSVARTQARNFIFAEKTKAGVLLYSCYSHVQGGYPSHAWTLNNQTMKYKVDNLSLCLCLLAPGAGTHTYTHAYTRTQSGELLRSAFYAPLSLARFVYRLPFEQRLGSVSTADTQCHLLLSAATAPVAWGEEVESEERSWSVGVCVCVCQDGGEGVLWHASPV